MRVSFITSCAWSHYCTPIHNNVLFFFFHNRQCSRFWTLQVFRLWIVSLAVRKHCRQIKLFTARAPTRSLTTHRALSPDHTQRRVNTMVTDNGATSRTRLISNIRSHFSASTWIMYPRTFIWLGQQQQQLNDRATCREYYQPSVDAADVGIVGLGWGLEGGGL